MTPPAGVVDRLLAGRSGLSARGGQRRAVRATALALALLALALGVRDAATSGLPAAPERAPSPAPSSLSPGPTDR